MCKDETLIHHDGALGDVLLSLPCIHLIRGCNHRIHFAGRPDIGRLLFGTGLVQEVSSAQGAFYASLYTDSPAPEAAAFLSRFSRAFVFSAKSRPAVASHLQRIITDVKVIITIPESAECRHAGEFRLQQLSGPQELHAHIPVPDIFRKAAMHMLQGMGYGGHGKIVAVHPGSGGRKKNWPLKNFLELGMKLLVNKERSVIFLCGPAEDAGTKEEVRRFSGQQERVILLDNADLTAVAAVLSLSELYIGNDSGISHLAAAVQTPSLVLFGPSDPRIWRPAGDHVRVLSPCASPGPLDALSAETVAEKVSDLIRSSSGFHSRSD